MNRLESLDWLRGLLALSIMLYHLTGWKLHAPDASELLGRLGVYGVSMFFVLSGLSMAVGYHEYIRDPRSALRFFIRRIFRIWPLLWLAVAAVSLGGVVFRGRELDWALILLNLSTLFGFVSPGAYINTGAWSIGNEMVYYALTPLFVWVYRQGLLLGNLAVAATLAVGLYFCFGALTPQAPLESQWLTYIHPLNNLGFYTAGLALFYNLHGVEFKRTSTWAMLLVAIAVFFAYPAAGDLIGVVTGAQRVVFFAASVLLVLAFYKITTTPPGWIARPLAALGIATYGVYLLHPVIFPLVEMAARPVAWLAGPMTIIATTVVLTIAASLVLYERLEAPFIRLGKRLTSAPHSVLRQPTVGSSGEA